MKTFDWVKQILSGGQTGLALFSPIVARDQNPLVRLAVGGGAIAGLLGAALVGASALVALALAMAAIYFLATQVLGLRVNVDPVAIYQTMQRQANAYGAN